MKRGAVLFLLFALLACHRSEHPPNYERAMKDNLDSLRKAVEKFRDDNGRGPHSLEELVPRYLRRIPADPVTQSAATWRLTTEETVQPSADFSSSTAPPAPPQIIDVHSGAPGADRNGTRWADY